MIQSELSQTILVFVGISIIVLKKIFKKNIFFERITMIVKSRF